MKFSKEEKSHSNSFYRKVYSVWSHMINRVYNVNSKDYSTYGAVGVITSEKWTTFDGFADDIDKIPGWNKEEFINGNLNLDKDLRMGTKIYDLNHTLWVTNKRNAGFRPNLMRKHVAMSPKGRVFTFYNVARFCRYSGIVSDTFYKLVNNKYHVSRSGWQVMYYEDYLSGSRKFITNRWEIFPYFMYAYDTVTKNMVFGKSAEALSNKLTGTIANGKLLSEYADTAKLFDGRYAIISHYRMLNGDKEYLKMLKPKMSSKLVPKYMTLPSGDIEEFFSIKEFSDKYGLDNRRVSELIAHKRKNDLKGFKFEDENQII